MIGNCPKLCKQLGSAISLGVVFARSNEEIEPHAIRVSDLPLYSKETEKKKHPEEELSSPARTIEEGVSYARKNVSAGYDVVTSQARHVEQIYFVGKEHSRFIFDYLTEPSNNVPRNGAIVLGGLSGYIIGLRHPTLRRLLYASIGAGTMASICYPKEGELYVQKTLAEAKVWATICVNFVYGVKPGDQVKAIELPPSITNAYSSILNMFKSSKDNQEVTKK